MLALLGLLTLCAPVHADATALVRLTNPQITAREGIVVLNVGQLGTDLPSEGTLVVRDDKGALIPSQVDDLDAGGGVSSADEIVFRISMPAGETTVLKIEPGPGEIAKAEARPESFWVQTDSYRAQVMQPGGWLSDLRFGDSANLLGRGLHQRLTSGGFEPAASWDQRALTASILYCRGPVRQTVVARYDFDEKPFAHPDVVRWAGELKPGLAGQVTYGFYPTHVSVTHRVMPRDVYFPVETSRVVIDLPLPAREPTVFDQWAAGRVSGIIPAAADLQDKGWASRPDLNASSWMDLTGPSAGLGLVADLRTDSLVTLTDAREANWGEGDFLCYQRFLDRTESTMCLAPHDPKQDATVLLEQLASPFSAMVAPGVVLPELANADSKFREVFREYEQIRRSEVLVTPALIQLQAARHLRQMARHCGLNNRASQAARLALEAQRRCEVAQQVLQCANDLPYAPLAPARGDDVFLGVYFGGNGKSLKTGQPRSLSLLKSYGISRVHDMDVFGWASIEPVQGQPDFTRADAYLDLLDSLGLRYLPCIDPWHHEPEWLAEQEDQEACIERYFDQVIPRYRSRDAILAWVVRNEPSLAPPADLTSLEGKAFVDWLLVRYGGIAALNESWGTSAAAGEDLRLTPQAGQSIIRSGEISPQAGETDILAQAPQTYDRNLYASQGLTAQLRDLADTAHELDPQRPALVKSTDAMLGNNPARVGDPWTLASVQPDVYCHNFYFGPELGKVGGGFGDYRLGWAFSTAVERSAAGGKPIWCGEWNAGWWGTPFKCTTRAETRLMTWTAVGEGLRGVFAFNHPSGQWPVGNFDDTPLPVLEEYGVLSAEFQSVGPIISEAQPWPADIAIYYPLPSIIHKFGSQRDTNPRDALGPRGPLRSLWQLLSVGEHYPVQFVNDEQLLSLNLNRFRVLVLVEAEFLSAEVAQRAMEFAERGGTLIMMGPCGVCDEHGHRVAEPPCAPLMSLIGGRLTAVRTGTVEVDGETLATGGPLACYELSAPDVRVLARQADTGEATVFARKVGAGQVLVIGGYLGVANATPDGAAGLWLTAQLCQAGAFPSVVASNARSDSPTLYARLFTHAGQCHLLLADLSGQDADLSLTVPVTAPMSSRPYDLLTGRPCRRLGGRTLSVRLPANEVMWVCL